MERVGEYTLVRKLGEGGMGVVHLALDPQGRHVALKMMRPELAAREEFRNRFGKEVEAARRVARFCTAPVLDAGFAAGSAYLVTEYVEGPDLAAVVAEQGPLAGSNLEALAVGVATALAAIHQAGVVHRDLKPSNVLLSPVGPRVIDFGIAQLADAGQGTPVTIAQSMGTPAYMSPEQAKGEPATPAGDVFSWGALVAYAGTGRPPFGTGGMPAVVYRVINHAPVLDGLDERIRPLVERALDKDPARRPTAQQLLDRLLGRTEVPVVDATRVVGDTWTPIVHHPAGPATVSPAGSPAGSSAGPRAKRRWWPVVLAVVVAAVLGVGGTLAVLRPWETRGNLPGTPQAGATWDTQESRLAVQIDSMERDGDKVRLRWTVRNVGQENNPLAGKLGGGALDFSVSRVNLVPPGVGKPIFPAWDGDKCRCAEVPVQPFNPGQRLQLWAVFEGVPADLDKADVDLVLGVVKDVPVSLP